MIHPNWAVLFCGIVSLLGQVARGQDLTELLPQLEESPRQSIEKWWLLETLSPAPIEMAKAVYQTNRLPIKLWPSTPSPDLPESAPQLGYLQGRVVQISKLETRPEWEELLNIRQLWLVRLEGREDSQTNPQIDLVTSEIPSSWQNLSPVGQPVAALFVSVANRGQDQQKSTLGVARRLRWLPDQASEAIPQEWIDLAKAGIDISALTALRDTMGQPLKAEESDLFYSLLAKAPSPSHAKRESLDSAVKLLFEPGKWVGRSVHFKLSARRVSRVTVSNQEMAERLGQAYYWQIDSFADFEDTKIQIAAPDGKSPPIDFGSRYPVSVVSKSLPAGVVEDMKKRSGERALVSQVNTMVVVEGTFFRLWSFANDFMRQQGGSQQTAPLVIATSLRDAPESGVSQESMERLQWVWTLPIFILLIIGGYYLALTFREASKAKLRRQRSPESFDATFFEPVNKENAE